MKWNDAEHAALRANALIAMQNLRLDQKIVKYPLARP